MPKDPIVVMKFGGSVLKDADGFRRAAEIIKAEKRRKIVVVSAMSGVTDELYKLAELAPSSKRDDFREDVREAAMKKYREIWSKHLGVLDDLNIAPPRPDQFEDIGIHLEKMIVVAGILKEPNSIVTDAIVSQGEKFSAIILSALIGEEIMFTYVPAKNIIKTMGGFGNPENTISWSMTEFALKKYAGRLKSVMVTEGFVGSTWKEQIVTLGRNGSDYSAAIIGSILKEVEEVQFWKDVPGMMTADPKLVPRARPISAIGYEEIVEATRLGANILHPQAIAPLFKEGVNKRVVICNINAPLDPGTAVVRHGVEQNAYGVTMVTAERNLIMYSVQEHMESEKHLAPKIYLALRQAGIEFATNSQGFSDKNFTIISHPGRYQKIEEILKGYCHVAPKEAKFECLPIMMAQIAVIGSNMRGKPGIAGRFLTALGNNGVNIRTIQQGSSECSMAVTIQDDDVQKALAAVHNAFDLAKT